MKVINPSEVCVPVPLILSSTGSFEEFALLVIDLVSLIVRVT